jgi:hypothetical protein
MRRLALIAAGALVALAAASVAVAAAIEDRDDSAGAVDLASARAAHNRATDELVYVVETHDPLDPRALLGRENGPPGSVCVNAWTRRTPGEGVPDYEICVTSDRDGDLHASVARLGSTGSVRRVGAADVEQTAERRLELRIDPDDLRRPREYRWTVQAVAFSDACPAVTGCEDYVPDRPRTSRTALRRPRGR